MVEAQYYIVRAHSSGLITKPMQVVDSSGLIHVSLGVRGYDILSAYPMRGFVDDKKKPETTWIANLGLLGKMAGAAAIVSNNMSKLENRRILIDTNIKALGVLGMVTSIELTDFSNSSSGIYISTLPEMNWQDRMMITILGKVLPVGTIKVSEVDAHVLEIDVESAWKELELESGWSNEVEVKIYINPAPMKAE